MCDADPALDTMSRMQQLADMCLGYGCVFAFVRVTHLLPANESLGPLLVTIGRMLRDIIRFSILFSLVQFGFTCALTCIYSGHDCENDHFNEFVDCSRDIFTLVIIICIHSQEEK